MGIAFRLQSLNIIRAFQCLFLLVSVFLFIVAYPEYKGESSIYVTFTIVSYVLLYFGFRKNAIFFDTFIGVFFWLGFWLKLTIRVAYTESQFVISTGDFDGSGAAFDYALLVTSCGMMGLVVASFVREKLLFVYPSKINEQSQEGLFALYKSYKTYILIGFTLVFVFVAVTNVYYGIYQRGTVPRTILPYGLSGIYKWLLLFGLASFSAMILKFEHMDAKKSSYRVVIISLMESFVSNASLLSRGMILNVGALLYGLSVGIRKNQIKSSIRFIVTCFILVVVLFGSSVVVVNAVRTLKFSGVQSAHLVDKPIELLGETTRRSTTVLFLDRWVGIEGVMAVSSYPKKGWSLWKEAWQEKYLDYGTSFYDLNLIESPYSKSMTNHHFISLPGIIAFCFYSGSFEFLFGCLFLIGLVCAAIEIIAFNLGGKNVILCALLAQVVAFRLCSFGYVPNQSYLLFGTIILNIIMIYLADKILVLWGRHNRT